MWAAILAALGPFMTLLNKLFDALKKPLEQKVEDDQAKIRDDIKKEKDTGRPV